MLSLTFAGLALAAGEEPWAPVPGATGTAQTLYGVDFVSNTLGWMVGAGGTILRTDDGGATAWVTQPSGTTALLAKVDFVDQNTGWVVGDGLVLRSTNGGTAWAPQPTGVAGALWRDVMFRDSSVGIVVGNTGRIARTTDGGATWTLVRSGGSQLRGISRVGDTWWVVGESGLVTKSIDNGVTWSTVTAPGSPMLFGVWFLDANKGFAVGGTRIYGTTNGGTTWAAIGPVAGGTLRGVGFANSSVGYAYGDAGRLFYTLDGGTTWTVGTSGTTQGLWDSAYPGFGYFAAGGGVAVKSGFDATPPPPPPAVSTSSSSILSLALLAVAGIGLALFAQRKNRAKAH